MSPPTDSTVIVSPLASPQNSDSLSGHSFQCCRISFEKIGLIPIYKSELGSVADADSCALGGGGADFGRVLGEITGTGHHADIGLLASVVRGCWLRWLRGLSGGHDSGARDRKREAKGYPGAKRDDLDPEAISFHDEALDSGLAGLEWKIDPRAH